MDCSTPGFSVIQYFLEFAQTHVRWVGDAIQISQTLSPLSPPALNLSQNQGLSISFSALSLLYGPPLTSIHDSRKNIALTVWTFVNKVILCFLIFSLGLSDFLQRSKCFLISCLQSPSTVILEPKKIKPVTISTFSPSVCHECERVIS